MQNPEIPKKIHYCWFGGKPLPRSAKRCIDSWRRHMPEYEICRWDESNYDINGAAYARAAYADGKYAYVSDYARMDILMRHGGVYFDTDVELVASPEKIIKAGPFLACEYTPSGPDAPLAIRVNPGLGMAAYAGHAMLRSILDMYGVTPYENPDGKSAPVTIVDLVTGLLMQKGLRNAPGVQHIGDLTIYPESLFCPLSILDGKLRLKPETVAIHHYDQTWQSSSRKLMRRIALKLGGPRLKNLIKKLIYHK